LRNIKQRVQGMKGHVDIKSKLNEGTEIVISIPL